MTHTARTTAYRARLLAGTAAAAIVVMAPLGSVRAQAASAIDMDFDAPAYVIATDFGQLLPQVNSGSVSATPSGNGLALDLTANIAGAVPYGGAYTGEDNTLRAAATANASNATVNLSFTPGAGTDTAAAGVYQTNSNTVSAASANDQHIVLVENLDASHEAVLSGALTVGNNDVLTDATANRSDAAIALTAGVNAAGTGNAAQVAIDETLAAAVDSAADADLLVSAAQRTSGAVSSAISRTGGSAYGAGTVDILVEEVSGASIAVTGSDIAAAATGNAAAGAISSADATATITASIAVTALQVVGASIDAANTDALIRFRVVDRNGDLTGAVESGTVTVVANTIAASGTGNTSDQSVALRAGQIAGTGTALVADGNTAAADVQLSIAGAAVAVASVQRLEDPYAVSSSVSSAQIAVRLDAYDTPAAGNTLSATSNTVQAASTGAAAVNALSLEAGATLSAPAAMAAVQSVDGDVTATASGNAVSVRSDESVAGSTLVTAGNQLAASVTGAAATNTLTVAPGTGNLSADGNTGGVAIVAGAAAGDAAMPSVTAAYALANDQSIGGTAGGGTASRLNAVSSNNRIATTLSLTSANLVDSTIHTGGYADQDGVPVEAGNAVTAAVVGSTAANTVALTFSDLQGDIVASGGVVAAAANSQVIQGDAALSARVAGSDGRPIRTYIGGTASGGTVTTSYNRVAASAVGNRTTANAVTVEATNAVIASGGAAVASVDRATGDVTAQAAFVAGSTQEFRNSSIQALLADSAPNPMVGDLIDTEFAGNAVGSTIASNANVLSAEATANSAANGITAGTAGSSTIRAASAVANAQAVSGSDVSALVGVPGSASGTAYSSLNGTIGSTQSDVSYDSGTGVLTVRFDPLTLTFSADLTAQEQQILTALGWQVTGAATVVVPTGSYNLVGSLSSVTLIDPTAGGGADTDESIIVAGFNQAGMPVLINGAGVTITAGDSAADSIVGATLAIADNTIVGQVASNSAVNTLTVSAATLAAVSATAGPGIDLDAAALSPVAADNALTNVQSVDGSSTLRSDVAGTFAILQPDNQDVSGSTLTVRANLQQSYATANTATNTIGLDANQTDAGAVLASDQQVAGPASASGNGVVTTSDLDVTAIGGIANSELVLAENQNQSVASGNVATNAVTVVATHANPVTGTAANAVRDASTGNGLAADAVLASAQAVTQGLTIGASAATNVENSDLATDTADVLADSTVAMRANQTIAQATANTATNAMDLGDGSTASYDASGLVYSEQSAASGAVVTATADARVVFDLNSSVAEPGSTIADSTVAVDGNSTTALARGNVGVSSLSVTATAIAAGTAGADASVEDAAGRYEAGFVVASEQANGAAVTADSSAATYAIGATAAVPQDPANPGQPIADEVALDQSTASLTGNTSTATASANTATNTLRLGSAATSSLAASGLVWNEQTNGNTVQATGGISVSGAFDSDGTEFTDAVRRSYVSIADNISTANASGNIATNRLDGQGTNIGGGSGDNAAVDLGSFAVSATVANVSHQVNADAITATNTANTFTASANSGVNTIDSSTYSVTGNEANAYATGNAVGNAMSNALSLGGAGTAAIGATAALYSSQENAAAVNASAAGAFRAVLDSVDTAGSGGTPTSAALNAGNAQVLNNSVLALARGNRANNAMTVAAASTTAGPGGAAGYSFDANAVAASYALVNQQSNTQAVAAQSAGARFEIALNTVGAADGVALNTGAVEVSNNTATAAAYGNIGTNTLVLTSLDGSADDATLLTANRQVNGGAVTATVTGGFAGVTANGSVVNSNVTVRGNTFSANAVGNLATSVMTRN